MEEVKKEIKTCPTCKTTCEHTVTDYGVHDMGTMGKQRVFWIRCGKCSRLSQEFVPQPAE